MPRSSSSCLLCVLLFLGLLSGSPKLANAVSIPEIKSLRTPSKNNGEANGLLSIMLTNTTNTTNVPTQAPTPAIAISPTTAMPTPTPNPTKKYQPSPDDEDEEKEGVKIGMIFLWIVIAFSLIWVVCYFRDAILFFFGNVSC